MRNFCIRQYDSAIELSSAWSPVFNIPRTSRRWWHRNEISDNCRWFYGVSGNPNDILSMTRRFGRHHGLRIVVWKLSNLIWASEVINVWKLAIESTLGQENKEALLEVEYFKKKNWYYGLKRKGGLVIGVTWVLFGVPFRILESVW